MATQTKQNSIKCKHAPIFLSLYNGGLNVTNSPEWQQIRDMLITMYCNDIIPRRNEILENPNFDDEYKIIKISYSCAELMTVNIKIHLRII